MALVGGEEQVQEVGGADEELGDLGSLITADQGRRRESSITHLKDIVVDLRAKP